MKLGGDKAQRCLRDGLAWAQQPTRIPEGAELERVAELVGRAAAAVDAGEVVAAQRPVPDEVGVGGRQGEQSLELRLGERAASGHGEVSQLRCSLSATAAAQTEQGLGSRSAGRV